MSASKEEKKTSGSEANHNDCVEFGRAEVHGRAYPYEGVEILFPRWKEAREVIECNRRDILIGHKGPIRSVQAYTDGRFLSFGADRTLRIWYPAENGSDFESEMILENTSIDAYERFSNGTIVTIEESGRITAIVPVTEETYSRFVVSEGSGSGIVEHLILPEGSIIAATRAGEILLHQRCEDKLEWHPKRLAEKGESFRESAELERIAHFIKFVPRGCDFPKFSFDHASQRVFTLSKGGSLRVVNNLIEGEAQFDNIGPFPTPIRQYAAFGATDNILCVCADGNIFQSVKKFDGSWIITFQGRAFVSGAEYFPNDLHHLPDHSVAIVGVGEDGRECLLRWFVDGNGEIVKETLLDNVQISRLEKNDGLIQSLGGMMAIGASSESRYYSAVETFVDSPDKVNAQTQQERFLEWNLNESGKWNLNEVKVSDDTHLDIDPMLDSQFDSITTRLPAHEPVASSAAKRRINSETEITLEYEGTIRSIFYYNRRHNLVRKVTVLPNTKPYSKAYFFGTTCDGRAILGSLDGKIYLDPM